MADLLTRLKDWQTVYPEDEHKPEGSLYEEAHAALVNLKKTLEELKPMTDQEKVKMMEDMNWTPAAQYWKEQYDRAKATAPVKGSLELEHDSDGIWLLDVGSKHGTFQLGHIPWQIIATYIKEYLND